MATLQSAGVQVQVIDESFYSPSAPGTVPMIFVASAQDKTNPSGAIALGTVAANAGKVWLITSQRDLTDTFGTPLFYTDASGNSQHGHELNEYGLQTAYSTLGVSSRAYIVRADVDTAQLEAQSSQPLGAPVAGTYWVDTDNSLFGIKEWNSSTLSFTSKTPIVLNDESDSSLFDGSFPVSTLGALGDYCVILTSANLAQVYYKNTNSSWSLVTEGFNSGKKVTISPHYTYPTFDTNTLTGSVWITTTTPSNGANWSVKYYNGGTQSWSTVAAPLYSGVHTANYNLDPVGGGKNIPVGSVFIEYNTSYDTLNVTADFKLKRRNVAGVTSITSPASTVQTVQPNYVFNVRETLVNGTWSNPVTISVTSSNITNLLGSVIPAFVNNSALVNVTASWSTATSKLTFTHVNGGDILIDDSTNSPISSLGFSTTLANVYNPPSTYSLYNFMFSNWKPLTIEARANAPYTDPADGTLWYNSVVDEVDIMIHDGTTWKGYRDVLPLTDPAGPLVRAIAPVDGDRSDAGPLVTGDIWISTDDLENYGKNIYVYNSTLAVGKRWVLQDVTDQSTPTGWLFADARWATAGTTLVPSSIASLSTSNYLDPDAPDPALYPKGMRLWNTRRSGFNVKKYITGYIDITANSGQNIRFSNQPMASYETDRWVSQNNVAEDGSGVFGRHSQRSQITEAFKSMLDSNTAIRDTDTLNFSLMATPGYPELIQNMIGLNTDRGITAFVVGDTPFRLMPTGTALSNWGNNTAGAFDNGDTGGTSYDEYMAMYYPSGYTNDNAGNNIVVPPSHMMLRTIMNSDSYQWFAPAGTRRGGIDNASSVGYIDAEGEFRTVSLHQGLRDVLDDVKINPIATLTGIGLVAYGQRTRARNDSALDRINVARLICYLRRQLNVLARPFLFEPNDAQTRREIKASAESLMLELVGQRALYDFIVVCDESNNTPARIDRSELYMDIAIEPVKAVEMIYIPLRLKNTGDIAAGL